MRERSATFTQQLFFIDRSTRIREDFTGYVTDSVRVAGFAGDVRRGSSDSSVPVCEDPRGTDARSIWP